MSDTALGPQWWRAADGKWHPPELRPPSARTAPDAVADPAAGGAASDFPLPTRDDASGNANDVPRDNGVMPPVTGAVVELEAVPDGTAPPEPAPTDTTEAHESPSLAAVPVSEPTPAAATFASSMPIRHVEPTYAWDPAVSDADPPVELQRSIPPFIPRAAPTHSSPAEPEPVTVSDAPVTVSDAPVVPTPAAAPVGAEPAANLATAPTAKATDPDAQSTSQTWDGTEPLLIADAGDHVGPALEEDDERSLSIQSLVFGDQAPTELGPATGEAPAAVPPIADPMTAVLIAEPSAPVVPTTSHSRVTEPIPAEPIPAEPVPVETVPAEFVAAEASPAVPAGPIPAEFAAAAAPAAPAAPAATVVVDEPTPTPSPEPLPTTVLHAPAPAEGGAPSHGRVESRPVEKVLAGPTVSGSAPRTTNIPASIAAKNAEHFKGSREFPDLLGMALKGSSLADQVEVKYDATSSRKAPTANGTDKEPSAGGSEKNGKRWKRKGR